MEYGNDNNCDISSLKEKLGKSMGDLDIENINQKDVENVLIDQLLNNPDAGVNDDIKDKIKKGDIDGLKDELIKYLDQQNGNDNSKDRIKGMLKNDDYDGLKDEIMGMLFKGMASEKKNEVNEVKLDDANTDEALEGKKAINNNPFSGLFDDAFLNIIINRFYKENMNDNRVMFLNSIKPFLSEKRKKAVNDCISIVNILSMMEKLGFKVGSQE